MQLHTVIRRNKARQRKTYEIMIQHTSLFLNEKCSNCLKKTVSTKRRTLDIYYIRDDLYIRSTSFYNNYFIKLSEKH